MTSVQTGSWIKLTPASGTRSVLIQNPTGNASCFVTQRLSVTGTTEAASPDTDPGVTVAADRELSISGDAPFWIKGTNTQSVGVTAFRN